MGWWAGGLVGWWVGGVMGWRVIHHVRVEVRDGVWEEVWEVRLPRTRARRVGPLGVRRPASQRSRQNEGTETLPVALVASVVAVEVLNAQPRQRRAKGQRRVLVDEPRNRVRIRQEWRSFRYTTYAYPGLKAYSTVVRYRSNGYTVLRTILLFAPTILMFVPTLAGGRPRAALEGRGATRRQWRSWS